MIKVQDWLQNNHPDILKAWVKFYRKSRLEYQKKWQKSHYKKKRP